MISQSSSYVIQQLIALLVVIVLLGAALRIRVWPGEDRNRKRGRRLRSVLAGKDGHWSTSRAAALLWTAVLGYMLLVVILIGGREGVLADALGPLIDDIDFTYLALLGGPFAAFLAAKIAVNEKVGN